jgi:hypothetical protein
VQEIDADGEVAMSNGAMCRLAPNSASHKNTVGDSCMPQVVPEDGFAESQAYLQTGAADCGTGACLVYHLEGDTTPGCEDVDAGDLERCADPAQAEDRVYCSCRCAGPGVASSELCDCPDGFSCQEELFRDAPEALRGGYCMRIPK